MNNQLVHLKEVAKFINGRAFKPSDWSDSGLPIIRIQNLTGTSDTFNYFNGVVDERVRVRSGDILISWSASLGVYRWQDNDAVLNQHIFKVRLNKGIEPDYFFYVATNAVREMVSRVHGSTMQHITKDRFDSIQIRLPDLSEQRGIAERLKQAEQLVRTRRYALGLTDAFLPAAFLQAFGDPVENPFGFGHVELEDELERIESGFSPLCEGPRESVNQWAVLGLGAVTTGIFKPGENKRLPDDVPPRPDLEVQHGDVLVTRKNTYDLVAACALVRNPPQRLLLPDTIFRFQLKRSSGLSSVYLWGLFSFPSFRRQVQGLAGGSAGSMPGISKNKFMSINCPAPPLPLQQEFAAQVERVECLRAVQRESLRQAENLFNSLLHNAFSS